MASLILEYADQGWHVRWTTPSTEEFNKIMIAFKQTIPLYERYWDPDAFVGRGGWWVLYGSLELVKHLFPDYAQVRGQLEQAYWEDYQRQRKEAQERFAREQLAEQQRQRQQGQTKTKTQTKARPKAAPKQNPQPKREEVSLPRSFNEALILLHLSTPVTAADIKLAYRTEARKCHPDHGGSHAAMVRINAAYELALKQR